MSEEKSSTSFPILELLGIVFVVLKLTHVIDWSWFWITAPFWGPISVWGCILAIALFVGLLRWTWTKARS